MEQYTDSQYDDDLTIGADEYDDSFQTSDIDLFEFGGNDDSPISRLKTLVLSIDWEITDEVLLQFHDEIIDLKDIWADDKVNMVYLQALEKIGLYIYREKADSHPNAIKLLLGMYYNLERIVLSEELSTAEKKQILMEDVRRFEKLKKLIGKDQKKKPAPVDTIAPEPAEPLEDLEAAAAVEDLMDLKAIVLGIDWEITDKDLLELREEAKRLESKYADSKPKLVFLQGIGTLGAYIRKKKSNSHADAFKILHSFYEGLEKIVKTPGITLAEEKAILLPEVEKFNAFKKVIARTLTSEEPVEDEEREATAEQPLAPAFADLPEETTRGFQEEEEAAALGVESPMDVGERLNRFFGGEKKTARESVEPAGAAESAGLDDAKKEAEAFSDAFFGAGDEQAAGPGTVDKEIALKGVDVETEADDDSEEVELPRLDKGDVAPALADSEAVSSFSEVKEEPVVGDEGEITDELTGRLEDFFASEEQPEKPEEGEPPAFEVPADVALQGVDVEAEGDEEEDEVGIPEEAKGAEEPAPAFADIEDDLEVPEDVLSDTELPMEPAEFEQPAVTSEEEKEVEVLDLESELRDLETEEEIAQPTQLEAMEEAPVAEPAEIAEEKLEITLEEQEIALEEQEIALEEQEIALEAQPQEDEREIEEGVDQFFSLEEPGAEEPVTQEEGFEPERLQPAEFEEEPAAEITLEGELPEEPEELEEPEEEVVFELVKEDLQAEEPELEPETPEEVEAPIELERQEPALEASEESITQAAAEEAEAESDVFVDLRGTVQSLALDVNENIIQGLFAEINTLRQQFVERPVEKTYLQLMSTVVQHIDQYRFNADDEANTLLSTLLENLEQNETIEENKAQEILLGSITKVLQWQQDMLNRVANRDADGFLALHLDMAPELPPEPEPIPMEPEEELASEQIASEEQAEEPVLPSATDKEFSNAIRREINALRDTLRKEIDELRKSMK